MRYFFAFILLLSFSSCSNDASSSNEDEKVSSTTENTSHSSIHWLAFDEAAFDQAEKEKKLLLLEVGANWCHWCHVMDEKTYSDKEVQDYLESHFILCREDQDSRPDLYAAYKKYGWPAIIVFDADKNEVLRLKGYQEKSKFLSLLEKTVENPVPLSAEVGTASSINTSDEALKAKFLARLDHEKGMYHWNNKYLPLEGIIHGIRYQKENDSLKKWVDITIKNSFELIDPVWGGAYQYSAKKSWVNQHYEKLLRVQANYMIAYALYYLQSGDQHAYKNAIAIHNYCNQFLWNEKEHLFYNSQNADVIEGQDSEDYYAKNEKERLKIGTPSVDQNSYLKENAMLAYAYTFYSLATGLSESKLEARDLTLSILKNYKTHQGVYNRNTSDQVVLAFEDNRRLIDLLLFQYQYLEDQLIDKEQLLKTAIEVADNLIQVFGTEKGMRATYGDSPIQSPIVQLDNLNAVLTFNLLGHLSGESRFNEQAQLIYSKLDQQELIKKVGYIPLLLRAQQELREEPYHAVVITHKNQDNTAFKQWILSCGNPYIIYEEAVIGQFTEEQELMYGGIDSGTLFMCTSSFCSAPMRDREAFQEFVNSI